MFVQGGGEEKRREVRGEGKQRRKGEARGGIQH
jgi:hypothetical protein